MTEQLLCYIIFALTYAGIAVGRVPGLTIDRTGIALLGAIAMTAAGVLPMREALHAIDATTILLLFGLMLVSAQLRLSGFYQFAAAWLGRAAEKPKAFLALLMTTAGVLSAVLVNDIVCLAFAPVVVATTRRARLNPAPYLIGLACASNIGSAATLIGNPQNMLIGQTARLAFGAFLAWSITPTLLAGIAAYGIVLALYRGRLTMPGASHILPEPDDMAFDRWQTLKGLLVVAAVMIAFFTDVPREMAALCAGGVLMVSRRTQTRELLSRLDWSLVMLFCGLFVVVGALESTGAPTRMVAELTERGIDVSEPLTLGLTGAVLGNVVSNVPAVMLLTRFLDNAPLVSWYALAVASTFAGNFITLGSIANLIVIEEARSHGVTVTFREHARAGIPVTLVSLAILAAWIMLGSAG